MTYPFRIYEWDDWITYFGTSICDHSSYWPSRMILPDSIQWLGGSWFSDRPFLKDPEDEPTVDGNTVDASGYSHELFQNIPPPVFSIIQHPNKTLGNMGGPSPLTPLLLGKSNQDMMIQWGATILFHLVSELGSAIAKNKCHTTHTTYDSMWVNRSWLVKEGWETQVVSCTILLAPVVQRCLERSA